MKKNIIVLGANGMVGSNIYKFFSTKTDYKVYGTARNDSTFFKLDVKTFKKDLEAIFKSVGNLHYLINCIGEVRERENLERLIEINSLFPRMLCSYLQNKETKIIHISTDSVYPATGTVNEKTPVSPGDTYSISKLLGEISSQNSITVRTSIIGISKRNYSLLDNIRNTRKKVVYGYTNQKWSGCTTIQFAKLSLDLFNNWDRYKRDFGPFINFSPIKNVTKYQILSEARKQGLTTAKIKKGLSEKSLERKFTSLFDNTYLKKYTCDISESLNELLLFNHD